MARPLLALFEKQPEFLLAHSIVGWRLSVFAATLGLGIPLAIAALVAGTRLLSRRVFAGVSIAAVAILVALTLLPILDRLEAHLSGVITLAGAATMGVIFAALYNRLETVRFFTSVLIAGLLIFPFYFTFLSPAAALRDEGEKVTADRYDYAAKTVVIMVLDEFPVATLLDTDLTINEHRYPNFARLANISTWYRFATTNAEATVLAVPSLLSGEDVDLSERRLPLASQYPSNLFSELADSHDMNVVESITRLCPATVCAGETRPQPHVQMLVDDLITVYQHIIYPKSYRHMLPQLGENWVGFNGVASPAESSASTVSELMATAKFGGRIRQFDDFVSSVGDYPPATVHYFHSLLPHSPFSYSETGQTYALGDESGVFGVQVDPTSEPLQPNQWSSEPWSAIASERRLALQVGAVDGMLGRLLDKLLEEGVLDDAALVVVGDHGANYEVPGSRRELSDANLIAIAGVPLFVKLPNQREGKTSLAPARIVDVWPTIASALGNSGVSKQLAGVPLQGLGSRADRDVTIFNDSYQPFALPFNQYKLAANELAKRTVERLGGGDWSSLYRHGPYPNIVGSAVKDFYVGSQPSFQSEILNPTQWDSVDLAAPFVPRLVRGIVANQVDQRAIAVAVNGRIVGVTRVVRDGNGIGAYQVVVPAETLRSGGNDLSVFAVETIDDEIQLIANGWVDDAKLTGERLLMQLESEKQDGPPWGEVITRISPETGLLEVGGWSADTLTGAPASKVLLAYGDSPIAVSAPDSPVPDVTERFGWEELATAGVRIAVRAPRVDELPIRVLASGGGRVSLIGLTSSPVTTEWTNISVNPNVRYDLERLYNRRVRQLGFEDRYVELDLREARAAPFLLGAWFSENPSLRWAGNQYGLILPTGRSTTCISVQALPFLVENKHTVQRVNLSLSGQPLQVVERRSSGLFDIELVVRGQESEGWALLTFESSTTASPQSLAVNEDGRELSLGFTKLSVSDCEQ